MVCPQSPHLSASMLKHVMKSQSDLKKKKSHALLCALRNECADLISVATSFSGFLYQVPLVQLPWDASGFDSVTLRSDKGYMQVDQKVCG